jgi:hypothetical protein
VLKRVLIFICMHIYIYFWWGAGERSRSQLSYFFLLPASSQYQYRCEYLHVYHFQLIGSPLRSYPILSYSLLLFPSFHLYLQLHLQIQDEKNPTVWMNSLLFLLFSLLHSTPTNLLVQKLPSLISSPRLQNGGNQKLKIIS